MSDVNRIFIRCEADWSYNLSGAIKEFVDPTPQVLEQYYQHAGEYLIHRHNFISGFIDNVQYTEAMYVALKPFENNGHLECIVKYSYENLYRRMLPVLNQYKRKLCSVTRYLGECGDVVGWIVQFVNLNDPENLTWGRSFSLPIPLDLKSI